ncbi:MAG TPA: selenocysteine-specific translation elongation factor [Candidatus Dormibacteraeota bacterium]|nr:selenocysteine-specific translation elongation factor [Candidatus Dormibacteraeota bacterium]
MHLILGTAGHIDHGKTALIKALTGTDTDRLKEERERGISIDLGFAHFDVGGGEAAGVVDVPGHERFIRNMLAGAHGIDLVLLVVAADDGVMPQTEEHLDILHLLGARRGVVAMSKVDLVNPARRRAVREEIEIVLAGTGLEGAPVIEVSTVTGEGIETLRETIRAALRAATRPPPEGCFRLPVDRAFVMRGHGVVVTGTATAGAVRSGATLRVLPGGVEVRVRGVQVHGAAVEEAAYGQRVALNLGGVEQGGIARGQVVCDPELDRVTDRFDAWVELRPAVKRPLERHAPVRVYAGTAETMGRIIWLDGRPSVAPKESAFAQLVLREPLAAFGGDRFILREATARATIGGGIVLDPFAPPARRGDVIRLAHLARLRDAASPLERLRALLAIETAVAVTPESLAAAANLRIDAVRTLLAAQADLRPLPDAAHAEAYVTSEKWQRLADAVRDALATYHREQPRERGMEMESLRSQLAADLAPKVFRAIVEQLARESALVREESLLRLPSHSGGLTAAEAALGERIVARLAAGGLMPPDVRQVAADLGIAPPRLAAILAALERGGRVARADADLYFAADAVERAKGIIRDYAATHGGEITAAALRDLIGASRKFSIGLLTYLDRTGFTLRIGDVRKVRG